MKVLKSAHDLYPGRMVGISSDGMMFLYGLTVRSTRNREARYSEIPIPRISVDYYDSHEKEPGHVCKPGIRRKSRVHARDPNTIYDALWASKKDPFAVISNGIHTGPLFGAYVHEFGSGPDIPFEPMENVLYEFGPESDGFRTPRIGLAIGANGVEAFGIVRDDGRPVIEENSSKRIIEGSLVLATYDPQAPDKDPMTPQGESMNEILLHAPVHGETPAELAESLYKWMEPSLRVLAIAGGWSGKKLHLAILDHRGLKNYEHALAEP
jgi:IMP cyclohydrolase